MTGTAPPFQASIAGLPRKVTVYEVGPRDGLQNEPDFVPTAVKAEFIDRLLKSGLPIVEATSLVSPRWVPQLADAEDLLSRVDRAMMRQMPVLVPNERGLGRAIELGVEHIAIFASATESFAARNLNQTLDSQFEMVRAVVGPALERGVRVRAYLSMCFGDPWEGAVPVQQVVEVGRRLIDLGVYQLSLGDTIGVATPGAVTQLLEAFGAAGVTLESLALHPHDTYGQALANALAAIQIGVTTIDVSAGGLGGCPYAKGATGNLATEDLVWMLHGLGIHTGVDLSTLVGTSRWMSQVLQRPSQSRVVRAIAAAQRDEDASGSLTV